MDTGEQFHLNQRISYADRRGTVRFLGDLERITAQRGNWAGIEWDQEKPGLHDGVVKGTRFFQARPNSASFLLQNKLSGGKSAWAAIQEKYGTAETRTDIGVRFGEKEVIAVGWEKVQKKISEFDRLVHVDLSGMDVNDSLDVDLFSVIPMVETLSLGQGLISSWSSVMRMISGLGRLTTLNLTDNRLLIDAALHSCGTVKRLVLPNNALVWKDILQILRFFPALEELYLSENNISTLSSTDSLNSSRISVIDLDSQLVPLFDWREVMTLGNIASLRVLQLSGNRIRSISIPDEAPSFSALTHLTLRRNEISDWRSISELNKLPRLENLKISFNPILDTIPPETARQWVIARIAALKVLNQSPIAATERRDSELDYMRRFGAEWLAITGDNSSISEKRAVFLQDHPRYTTILERFGPLEAGEVQSAGPKQLRDSLIKVTVLCGTIKLEKSLPLTISVQKLKRLVERLFGLQDTEELWYVTPDQPGTRYILDDDQKDIAYYDIKSGDTVMIK